MGAKLNRASEDADDLSPVLIGGGNHRAPFVDSWSLASGDYSKIEPTTSMEGRSFSINSMCEIEPGVVICVNDGGGPENRFWRIDFSSSAIPSLLPDLPDLITFDSPLDFISSIHLVTVPVFSDERATVMISGGGNKVLFLDYQNQRILHEVALEGHPQLRDCLLFPSRRVLCGIFADEIGFYEFSSGKSTPGQKAESVDSMCCVCVNDTLGLSYASGDTKALHVHSTSGELVAHMPDIGGDAYSAGADWEQNVFFFGQIGQDPHPSSSTVAVFDPRNLKSRLHMIPVDGVSGYMNALTRVSLDAWAVGGSGGEVGVVNPSSGKAIPHVFDENGRDQPRRYYYSLESVGPKPWITRVFDNLADLEESLEFSLSRGYLKLVIVMGNDELYCPAWSRVRAFEK